MEKQCFFFCWEEQMQGRWEVQDSASVESISPESRTVLIRMARNKTHLLPMPSLNQPPCRVFLRHQVASFLKMLTTFISPQHGFKLEDLQRLKCLASCLMPEVPIPRGFLQFQDLSLEHSEKWIFLAFLWHRREAKAQRTNKRRPNWWVSPCVFHDLMWSIEAQLTPQKIPKGNKNAPKTGSCLR